MKLTFDQFKSSISDASPPAVPLLLKALWYDAKGDFDQAHTIAQDIETSDGAWVHAYLHRKEGDNGNARYWYGVAVRQFPASTLDEEWQDIAKDLLARRT